MKKRFGMLLALVLVVLLGMTAVAMAEKCADGDCVYNIGDHGGNRCYICNYNKADGKEHRLTNPVSNPQWSNGKDHLHSHMNCSVCGAGTYTVKVEMDPNWHDGTACKDCGCMFKSGEITHNHTWDAATRKCTVCGVIPETCPGHVYNKKYYDLATGKPVCDLCHGTGLLVNSSVLSHVPFGSAGGKEPNVAYGGAPHIEEVKENYHVASRWCITYDENGAFDDTHTFAWNEDHKFVKRDNHKVEICYGCTYVNNGVVVSYGCLVDKYGNIHTDVNCPYCCPNDSCPDGVLMDGPHGKVCNKCGEDADGNEHKITSTTYTYKDENNHTRTEICSGCEEPITGNESHTYNQTGHEAPYCVCGADANGKMHSGTSAECKACEQIRKDNECKHRVLGNRYYTWHTDKYHVLSAVCLSCGESVGAIEAHSYNKTWHEGTVCVNCHTDANGVKHDWLNGVCSVCPKPIPDGLNPDDGWVYEGGEKSDFTGLYPYNGGMFYIKNGQWQRGANGLTLIGEEFWYLANGQVQEHHGFAEYDGEWFYLDGGKLDVTASGVFKYDGEWFLVAAGRLVSEYSGLAQVPSGEWYYVAEGRVLTEFSGTIEWNGGSFQIVNGKMVA